MCGWSRVRTLMMPRGAQPIHLLWEWGVLNSSCPSPVNRTFARCIATEPLRSWWLSGNTSSRRGIARGIARGVSGRGEAWRIVRRDGGRGGGWPGALRWCKSLTVKYLWCYNMMVAGGGLKRSFCVRSRCSFLKSVWCVFFVGLQSFQNPNIVISHYFLSMKDYVLNTQEFIMYFWIIHARYVRRTRSEPGEHNAGLYSTVKKSQNLLLFVQYAVVTISYYSGIVLGYQK